MMCLVTLSSGVASCSILVTNARPNSHEYDGALVRNTSWAGTPATVLLLLTHTHTHIGSLKVRCAEVVCSLRGSYGITKSMVIYVDREWPQDSLIKYNRGNKSLSGLQSLTIGMACYE